MHKGLGGYPLVMAQSVVEASSGSSIARVARGEEGTVKDDVPAMRVAVVDIGTNSTRLLIADVEGTEVREVERRTTVTNLGRGVEHTGNLCSDAVDGVCGVVADYMARYQELGAERVLAIATSAVRDAVNGEAFIAELRERFDLHARLLTGEEEAHLTYLGATAQRSGDETMLVFDIGGRLDRADRRLGERGRLPHLASGRNDPALRAAPDRGPAGGARARGAADDVRNLIDDAVAARGGQAEDEGDRGRRHPDLAGRDRPGAGAL